MMVRMERPIERPNPRAYPLPVSIRVIFLLPAIDVRLKGYLFIGC